MQMPLALRVTLAYSTHIDNAPEQRMTKTTKAAQEPKLPAHLAALAKKIDANNKKHGFTDFSKIDRNKFGDFHPIHALIG